MQRVVKNNSELKETIKIIMDEYNKTENFNIGLLDVTILDSGEMLLDIPVETRGDSDELQRLFVMYIKDDGEVKPVSHLQTLESDINSLAQELYNSNDGWQTNGFSFIELPDKEVLVQTTVQKSFAKKI